MNTDMTDAIKNFRQRVSKKTGINTKTIDAAWPEWWSDEAASSPSAQAELYFSVARKLGLDPRSLLDSDGPSFMWNDFAKYKNFNGTDIERQAISSFGTSIARIILSGTEGTSSLIGVEASFLRQSILKNQEFVRYQDLLSLLWAIGIPTIYLCLHPLPAKHMCAMAVSVGERHAILLSKNVKYPAWAAFHLAHEIGHIALGHVEQGSALIDMDDPLYKITQGDNEESASDRFALELLTGNAELTIEKIGSGNNARELASRARSLGHELRIEPGTLALCYGYSTKEWATVQAALTYIYSKPLPAWEVTNKIAKSQIQWDRLGDDNSSFISAVMGGV